MGIHSAGTIVSTGLAFFALWFSLRRLKANHSLPQCSLLKYRRE